MSDVNHQMAVRPRERARLEAARWYTDAGRQTISTDHDDRHTRWCSRYTVGALVEHFRHTPPSSILDVGCGGGGFLEAARNRFPASRLVGVDPDPHALKSAYARAPFAELVQCSAENLLQTPLYDSVFDAVVAQLNFALWEDPGRGLENLVHLLAPEGLCYIVDPVVEVRAGSRSPASAESVSLETFLSDQADASFTVEEASSLVDGVLSRIPQASGTVSMGGILGYPEHGPDAARIWRENPDVREALLSASRSSDAELMYIRITKS